MSEDSGDRQITSNGPEALWGARVSPRCLKWLLLALAVLPTIGALNTPFLLDYDDWWIIASNPFILKGWSGFSDLVSGSLEYSHMQLTYLSAALDYTIWGDWAGGYRLVNALFHGLSALLVFRLGRTLLRGPAGTVGTHSLSPDRGWGPAPADATAFLAALLFSVHPLAVESVAWVIERKTLLAQFFGLAALTVYITGAAVAQASGLQTNHASGVSWKRVALAFLLLLLAQFGKTSAISFWFVFAAVEALWFHDARWKRALRAGVMLLPCLFGAAMALTSHSEHFVTPLGGDSALLRIAGALHLHGRAWGLALWPFNLSAFYHVSPAAAFDGWAAFALLLPALAVLLYHRLGLGWQRGLLLVLWAVAGFSPNMNPFRGLAFLLQDRYAYRSLAPAMLLTAELLGACAAWAALRLAQRGQVANRQTAEGPLGRACQSPLVWLGAILACVLAAYSALRSAAWRSEPRLFADAAAKQPDSAFGHAYLAGNLYFHATNPLSTSEDRAPIPKRPETFPSVSPGLPAGISAASWQARNEYLRTEYARLLALESGGDRQPISKQPETLPHVSPRPEGSPRVSPPWAAELQQAMLRRSLQEHQAALKCDDFDHLVYPFQHLAEHARLLLLFQQREAAARLYRRIWEGRPERPTETGTKLEALRFLAVEALRAKRFETGLRYLEEGLRLEPNHSELLSNRLLALEDSGRVEEARTEARRLLANPDTASVARDVLKRLEQGKQ